MNNKKNRDYCPECKARVPRSASHCHECGARLLAQTPKKICLSLAVISFILGVAILGAPIVKYGGLKSPAEQAKEVYDESDARGQVGFQIFFAMFIPVGAALAMNRRSYKYIALQFIGGFYYVFGFIMMITPITYFGEEPSLSSLLTAPGALLYGSVQVIVISSAVAGIVALSR